jgi:ABC-2 type transport system permease protein
VGKYLEYLRISFLNIFAFRARYYVGIVTYIIYIAIYYSIWKAIYAQALSIDGISPGQMTTYVAVGWISRSFFFNNLDRDIERKVVDGSLGMDLLKPVDFQAMAYARTLGEILFRLVLFALPTAVVAVVLFPVAPPVSVTAGVAFVLSSLMAALIYTNINFMIGTLAVPFKNIEGIAYAKQNLLLFLSGLVVPFDLLPPSLAAVLKVLPFASISYLPLNVYLGRVTGAELAASLGVQAVWVVVLFLVARGLWSLCTRRIVIQGG